MEIHLLGIQTRDQRLTQRASQPKVHYHNLLSFRRFKVPKSIGVILPYDSRSKLVLEMRKIIILKLLNLNLRFLAISI